MKLDAANPSQVPPPVVIDGRYLGDRYPGIARYLFNLSLAIAEVAPALSLTLLVDPEERQTRFDLGELTARGVALEPVEGSLRSLRGYFAGRRAARQRAPAVFHAPHVFSALPAAQPSVVTIHDLIPTYPPARLQRRRDRALYRLLLRRALLSAGGVLTPSPVVADELERRWGVARRRITVTPEAADRRFGPQRAGRTDGYGRHTLDGCEEPPSSAAMRSARSARSAKSAPRTEGSPRLDLPERYVLYVGTDRPHKNLPRLLRAWAAIDPAFRRGCHLVVAGANESRGAGNDSRGGGNDPRGRGDDRQAAWTRRRASPSSVAAKMTQRMPARAIGNDPCRKGDDPVGTGGDARPKVGEIRLGMGAAPDVLFLGFVDEADLPRVYRGAQMLVHPALREGFGLTVIEAMASGVPVACSSSPSLDPVCGDAALRFDPRDAGAIAAAIERLLQDVELRDRLIAAGTARAAELSWSRTAELTLRAYRRAARHAATATSA